VAEVRSWRQSTRRTAPDTGADNSSRKLHKTVWEPLAKHLGGVKTVLISPDPEISTFPVGALPGSRPGTYLLEDVAIGTVPVPRLLPHLLEPPDKKADDKASLLVVGDVDFDAAAGVNLGGRTAATTRDGKGLRGWQKLPATRAEMLSISDLFEQKHQGAKALALHGAQATEPAVPKAPDQHRCLHPPTPA